MSVTNQDLGVTTKTSGHMATTQGPSDIDYDPPKAIPMPHMNYATTDNAVEHTSGKTLFEGGNVVRLGEAISPSDPPHPDVGGGLVSSTYRAEARATRGSQNVRAEGKPPARTDDPTTQNQANTTGKMSPRVKRDLLKDNSAESRKRCSYDTSKINCDHQEPTQKKKIEVWRGDTITVKAKRKNAKEPNKGPECAQPPHMKWKVTRTGGVNDSGSPLTEKSEEFSGDTLTLPSDWTGPGGTLEHSGEAKQHPDVREHMERKGRSWARTNAMARGAPMVSEQDKAVGSAIYGRRGEQLDHSKAINRAHTAGDAGLAFAQFLIAYRADQNPPKIAIKGNACSGEVSYEVTCYPNKKFGAEVPLDPLNALVSLIQKAFSVARSVGGLANVQVEMSLVCPGDVSIGVEAQWAEDENGSYEIQREVEFSVNGTLATWTFDVSFSLTSLLAITPLGPWGAKLAGWFAEKLVDVRLGAAFDLSLKAVGAVTWTWSKAKGLKFTFDHVTIKIQVDFKFYLYIKGSLGDWAYAQVSAVVAADPALSFEVTKDGAVTLKSADFMVRVGFAGTIHVDVHFFRYQIYALHESGTWWPEGWTSRVKSRDLAKFLDGSSGGSGSGRRES